MTQPKSIPAIPPMPYPQDPESADGYDGFRDSVNQANANFDAFPAWSQGIVTKTYTGTEYGTSTIGPMPNWTCQTFLGIKVDHLITVDATFTYDGPGFTFGADCSAPGTPGICTLPSGLRASTVGPAIPLTTHARIADTAVYLVVGFPTTSVLALFGSAVPSRAIATGAQLSVHATYWWQLTFMP